MTTTGPRPLGDVLLAVHVSNNVDGANDHENGDDYDDDDDYIDCDDVDAYDHYDDINNSKYCTAITISIPNR